MTFSPSGKVYTSLATALLPILNGLANEQDGSPIAVSHQGQTVLLGNGVIALVLDKLTGEITATSNGNVEIMGKKGPIWHRLAANVGRWARQGHGGKPRASLRREMPPSSCGRRGVRVGSVRRRARPLCILAWRDRASRRVSNDSQRKVGHLPLEQMGG